MQLVCNQGAQRLLIAQLQQEADDGPRWWAAAGQIIVCVPPPTAPPNRYPSTCLLLQALPGPAEVNAFIEQLNKSYEKAHVDYERNFWSTKMGLADASSEQLAATKTA